MDDDTGIPIPAWLYGIPGNGTLYVVQVYPLWPYRVLEPDAEGGHVDA